MRYALIVAGGKGERMRQELPKQFIMLEDMPVLMHTIRAFAQVPDLVEIILVLPAAHLPTWDCLCKKFAFKIPHRCVRGGASRTESVQNGLKSIESANGLVCIHDGVRPLVSAKIITNTYEVAEKYDAAVAAVPLKDSIRKQLANKESRAVPRTDYLLVQTPQTFCLSLLKSAYQKANRHHQTFTDDASLVEAAGHKIKTVCGCYENIKITTAEDLALAKILYLKRKNK